MNICKKRNAKALMRLKRQRAFVYIINRLTGHRGGKTFMVNTEFLKVDPPYIKVTERFSPVRLLYVKEVTALVTYEQRKLRIEIIDNVMTYIIE